jgi:hypothetical protein
VTTRDEVLALLGLDRLLAAGGEELTQVTFVPKKDMDYVMAAEGQVQALARLREVFPARVLGTVFVLPEQIR